MSMESSLAAPRNPRPMNPEARFLEYLRAVAAGAARIDLDTIQSALSVAFPHLDGSPDRRAKLREMLDTLAGSQLLRLPVDRKRGWQNKPAPPLPLRVTHGWGSPCRWRASRTALAAWRASPLRLRSAPRSSSQSVSPTSVWRTPASGNAISSWEKNDSVDIWRSAGVPLSGGFLRTRPEA